MKRFRWFKVEWPSSIRTLAKRIAKRPFNEESGHGFFVDRVRDDFLEARYVEKIEYTDIVTDPFGNELKFDRVEFRHTIFRASSFAPGLELIDPPRSVQALMNRLSEAVDFEVAITPVSLDVLKWATLFQESGSVSAEIDSLQIGALEIEKGIVAKVLVKGDRDVRAACDVLTHDRKFSIEKVQLRLSNPYRKTTVVLSGTGAAVFSSDTLAEELLSPLRIALTGAMQLASQS
ncbi:TPA: hypothetical protein ACGJ7L_004465 [Pseudomonas aeruginosa]|uniref:Uncharacterized protein n=3 Tax=Pseudomonadota TaxID=1224 RepID=A0A9P1R2G5_PSEAI|nr:MULTISPECIES: hypothetical protein [Pseudomonadota]CDI95027.1 hypothetical protein BN889_07027 [Pseudomonas aeruginosa PA38182]AXL78686.1 hypothetical protein Y82_4651 [Pseudomonas aeruginosa]EIU2559155.1 hypothetical protein [Pseudomonas aeruginosa]EIU2664438.1 hypothetical protein [Pseudomonas aeruginosa]EIU2677295.1 hypothetical protein [Pseudomonas aeruginosa]